MKRSESALWLCSKSSPPWLCLRNAGGRGWRWHGGDCVHFVHQAFNNVPKALLLLMPLGEVFLGPILSEVNSEHA